MVIDEPQGFSSSIPALWEVTSSQVAVVRLPARNRETWEKKGLASSAELFQYLYSEPELTELSGPIGSLAAQVQRVHVPYNNNYQDCAQRNARELRALFSLMSRID